MTISGNRGSVSAGGERAHTAHHPPILGNAAVKGDNGAYPIGLIVMEDENSLLVPYVSSETDTPAGVIDEPVDTATESSAFVLRHGTVRAGLLKVGPAGDAAADDDIKKLATIGIFAI